MTKLDELEALANAATDPRFPFCWHSWEGITDDGYAENDAKFICACTPQTIKQLIALCRLQNDALEIAKESCDGSYTKYDTALAAFDAFQKEQS